MSNALVALLTGAATGAVMARAGLCFNRSLRRAAFERRPTLLRAFAIAVAVQLVLLPALIAADVAPLERSADAGGPALLPAAELAAGLVFGAGMALAGGCVTGTLCGGTLAGRRRLSLPDSPRAARAIAGGLLMGAGGSIAHGCNIGHSVTGIPLLSFGSLLATASIAAGALRTWRLMVAPHPRLRGTDRLVAAARTRGA